MPFDIRTKTGRVSAHAPAFGTAVVIALIEEPEGPKLIVEAMAKTWLSAIHGVFSGDTLHQRVVVGEIGKAAKARAALADRRLVAVGPGCDVGGTVL